METEEDFFRKGTIMKFFAQSGYGFIRDDKGHQVYFHLDEIRFVGEPRKRSQIKEGMKVGFDISRTSRGVRATHLKFYGKVPESKNKKALPSGLASNPSGTPSPKPKTETPSEPAETEKIATTADPTLPETGSETRPPDSKSD